MKTKDEIKREILVNRTLQEIFTDEKELNNAGIFALIYKKKADALEWVLDDKN